MWHLYDLISKLIDYTSPKDIKMDRYEELKLAEKGALLSIFTYVSLAMAKLLIGHWGHSNSLFADGMNNLTDIISSTTVFIGLRVARKPADHDHTYGHWKFETVASMITSFIMLTIGLEVLGSTIEKIAHQSYSKPEPLTALVGIFSAIVMVAVYFYNRALARRVNSQALLAAAKDNLSDAYTSIGTSVAILATIIQFPILDTIAAIVIAALILTTALGIFRESVFSLSDGFSEEILKDYEKMLLNIDGIREIRLIRGRTYGSNIFLDVVVAMDADLSVLQSHHITEIIENRLRKEFNVYDIDVHVEPYMENN
ncbi:MAG: cation diffusion facilitator family transporter [Lactobacillales bacterium]|nr:cation diffusion facilitator family transporter [Lactobacillales bacterium]